MPPKKYTVDEISELLDEKLSAFKNDTLSSLLDEKLMTFKSELLNGLKEEIMSEVKILVDEKDSEISKLQDSVKMLQQHVNYLKTLKLEKSNQVDDLEQYGRRLCLRIDNVEHKDRETADDVLNFVKEKIEESGTEIPDSVLDRAHRIGNVTENSEGKKVQSIIVRFTTFRHRTMFYRKRNDVKKLEGNPILRLDLTKHRFKLLKNAQDLVKNYSSMVKFVYADINCRLRVKFVDQNLRDQFFEDIDELKKIVLDQS